MCECVRVGLFMRECNARASTQIFVRVMKCAYLKDHTCVRLRQCVKERECE